MKITGTISRRSAIQSIASIGSIAAAGSAFSCAGLNSKKTTAFALIGDRWHNPDYIRTALARTFVQESNVSIDFTSEVIHLSGENLKGYRLLIIFRDGMIIPGGYTEPFSIYDPRDTKLVSDPPLPEFDSTPVMWMTAEQGKAVRNFVENGGSALFYHNVSHVSLSNEDFRHVEGAIYTGHPPLRPFKLKIINKEHPITKGVNDFIVTDDQHYVIYDKDPKYVLMRSENENGLEYTGSHGNQGTGCEACWAYDYGKGRVCFMSPGHLITTLWNPEYVKLQKNAVRWLLKEI